MKRFIFILIVALMAAPLTTSAQPQYLCGDATGDGVVNLLDVLTIISGIYNTPPGPIPNPEMADVNNDGVINLLDILKFITIVYYENDNFSCGLPYEDYDSGCLGKQEKSGDTMYVEVDGFDIHVHHDNAYYDCCLGYSTTNNVNYDTFIITEHDTIPECDCYCYFNLETVIPDVLPGTYVIQLIGLGGETVGVDTVAVGGSSVYQHYDQQSDCASSKADPGDDSVFINVVGNDLTIYHLNAYYNCGLAYALEYYIEDNAIYALETDTGQAADCYCNFNLQSALYDLPDGDYDVYLGDINTILIFSGHITIDGNGGLITFDDSGCLEKSPDKDDPQLVYTYFNGQLTMNHYDAFFNCGANLVVAFEQSNDTLRFFEINVSNQYMYCMCIFATQAIVGGIAPGEYVLELYSDEPSTLFERRTMTF